ncbi:MAG: UDP-N-acetylmuramate dehydrogenase [Gammaproteobacteria bacterium]|nr:MAG: UDP-N-acetylmuramate dehydrogenase [Gammaproteobacteria bacterium]
MSRVLMNEPMSKHTSWRLGGPADTYFRPDSLAALRDFLRGLDDDAPVYFTGLGSNLLVRDGGIRGVVINPLKALGTLTRLEGGRVEAGAGVACTVLAKRCAAWGLGPSDFFAGIPGTIGGALAMNAGAFGGETWDHVVEVETVDRYARLRTRSRSDYQVAYREISAPQDEWFVTAYFAFDSGDEFSLDRVRALMRERQDKQPLGLPSCGSVFRNPPGQFAAQLIESAGLKGCRIGGAVVSDKHANFIINTGDATAADVEALIAHIRDVVTTRHGVSLDLEVHIVGEAS